MPPEAESPSPLSRHLFLIGYRGSGKSSVGKLLARRLACPWVDSDDLVEAEAGMSIADIFSLEEEDGFRTRETAAIRAIVDSSPAVVSLGGGAVLREENRALIRAGGLCVWLRVDPETVLERLALDATSGARRPSLTVLPPRQEVEQLLARRRPIYESTADFAVDTSGRLPEQIADDVQRLLADRVAAGR